MCLAKEYATLNVFQFHLSEDHVDNIRHYFLEYFKNVTYDLHVILEDRQRFINTENNGILVNTLTIHFSHAILNISKKKIKRTAALVQLMCKCKLLLYYPYESSIYPSRIDK